jgi:transcriptional regulator with XRE-family HTH domain
MDTVNSDSTNKTNKNFGEALLELKNRSGLSYMQIAIKCGLSDAYLINIVKGKNQAPNTENIEKIAKAFNIGPEYFKEYRIRKVTDQLLFSKNNYDVPLSDKEIEYLARLIEKNTEIPAAPNVAEGTEEIKHNK